MSNFSSIRTTEQDAKRRDLWGRDSLRQIRRWRERGGTSERKELVKRGEGESGSEERRQEPKWQAVYREGIEILWST